MSGAPICDDRLARAAITTVTEAGDPRVSALVREHGALEGWERIVAGLERQSWAERARKINLVTLAEDCQRYGLRIVIPDDDEWPVRLSGLDSCEPVNGMAGCPVALWVKGNGRLADLTSRAVAIVGARACTSYGRAQAEVFAYELCRAGYTIVSGGAYGVDAGAHRGALRTPGRTVVVSAGGLHVAYPRSHSSLFAEACAQGAVVSETPPGLNPTRPGFLARNRLIAGLADATLIVEAGPRSGAKNTTSWADALSLPVLAVPGPVHSSLSATPNALVRDHRAQLVTSAEDVLAFLEPLGVASEPETRGGARRFDDLSVEQSRVREALPGTGSMDLDAIALASGVPLRSCAVALSELEDLGMVEADGLWGWRLARR